MKIICPKCFKESTHDNCITVENNPNLVICENCKHTFNVLLKINYMPAIKNEEGQYEIKSLILEYRFMEKWDENVEVEWWKECRKILNKIIDKYNRWQLLYDFDKTKAQKLLNRIRIGQQSIGTQDGGSCYMKALEKMESFVNECIEQMEYID